MEKSAGGKVRNHIPDDLAFSILSKLPLKSLKRFGCVRKSWSLLFENPHFMSIFRSNFISKHHSYYDDTSLLLQLTDRADFYSLSGSISDRFEDLVKLDCPNPFQEDDPYFYILDSGTITGILCLYSPDHHDERVVLWNPATKEFKVTPPSPSVESVPSPQWDPFVVLYGFGYDHLRDDYKLIRHVQFFRDTQIDLYSPQLIDDDPFWEIYSLRSNYWRKLVDVDMPQSRRSVSGERLYMDGMCHWWGHGGSETHNESSPNTLYFVSSFDLSNEVFFITPIPLDIDILSDIGDSFYYDWVQRHLVVLNGSIALISWYVGTTTFHISILGEIGVKESWTKLFIIGPLPCIEHPIGVGKKGDIFFRRTDVELVWFDLSTQMIEELGVKGEFDSHVVIYKESLFSIGGIHY